MSSNQNPNTTISTGLDNFTVAVKKAMAEIDSKNVKTVSADELASKTQPQINQSTPDKTPKHKR